MKLYSHFMTTDKNKMHFKEIIKCSLKIIYFDKNTLRWEMLIKIKKKNVE